ncbi:MAG: uroporphyrinogen-III synthase [Magnetospirillum sp. WYHS-4]
MRLLVTRPEEDAQATAALLASRGHQPYVEPLVAIHIVSGPKLVLEGVQALLVTSANGVRAFVAHEDRRDLPVFAVGDASARAARAAGFVRVESAAGDVQTLARLVERRLDPRAGDLLHGAGSKVAGDLGGMLGASGFRYRREVLYEQTKADSLSADTERLLREDGLDGVLLYSPRTGATFAHLLRDLDLEAAADRLTAFCLSPAVAEKVSHLQWKAVRVAPEPTQDSLLDLLEP